MAVGAALTGALIPSILSGRKELEETEKASKRVAESFEIVNNRVVGLSGQSSKMEGLDPISQQIELMAAYADATKVADKALTDIRKTLDDEVSIGLIRDFDNLFRDLEKLNNLDNLPVRGGRTRTRESLEGRIAEDLEKVAQKYDLTTKNARKFIEVYARFSKQPQIQLVSFEQSYRNY